MDALLIKTGGLLLIVALILLFVNPLIGKL